MVHFPASELLVYQSVPLILTIPTVLFGFWWIWLIMLKTKQLWRLKIFCLAESTFGAPETDVTWLLLPRKTNIAPKKNDSLNAIIIYIYIIISFLLKWSLFRGHSFNLGQVIFLFNALGRVGETLPTVIVWGRRHAANRHCLRKQRRHINYAEGLRFLWNVYLYVLKP